MASRPRLVARNGLDGLARKRIYGFRLGANGGYSELSSCDAQIQSVIRYGDSGWLIRAVYRDYFRCV